MVEDQERSFCTLVVAIGHDPDALPNTAPPGIAYLHGHVDRLLDKPSRGRDRRRNARHERREDSADTLPEAHATNLSSPGASDGRRRRQRSTWPRGLSWCSARSP